MTQDTAETRQLISGKGEEHPATEPDGGEHPARSRDFAGAIVNNIRLVRQDFEPQPFPDSFLKRPVVVAFVVLYAITGVGVPLYLFRSHYDDLRGSGDAHSIFEDDWHKHRVAKAYLCFIPATLLAIPVFSPALATASVMPYLLIVVFAVKEAVNQVVKDDFKHFLIRALSNLLATLCALSYLRFMDYLDHIVHQIMVCEHSLLEEKPVKKMKGILHSVGLTRTGNPTADKFMAASTHNRGIADVVYEKVWHPLRSGSNIVVAASYISYTLISPYAGSVLACGFSYYLLTAVFIGYRFWDQVTMLIKIWTHKPFFVGDLVTIKRMGRGADTGIDGFVEHVTLSYVLIRTFDYKQTYLPLCELLDSVIQNWSRRPTKPLLMNFTASPSSNPEKVNELVSFAKRWIDESQNVLQSGYKKCCLSGFSHGFEIKVICSPGIGKKKRELQQSFILAVTAQAEKLNVTLASEDAASVFLPDEMISNKSK